MKCQARTEVYSRVCGYYRPVQQWNPGKADEYRDRLKFNLTLAQRSAVQQGMKVKVANTGESA